MSLDFAFPGEARKWHTTFKKEKDRLMKLMEKRPKLPKDEGPVTKEYRAQRSSFMLLFSSAVNVLGQNPEVVRINTGMYI